MTQLRNNTVQLIGSTAYWGGASVQPNIYILETTTLDGTTSIASIIYNRRTINVYPAGTRHASARIVMPNDSTLHDLELKVYDVLVERGLLDPMVAVLL